MWNQKFSGEVYENDTFNRFTRGIPPSSSAAWGWIQHMFASLNERGKMAVVLDTGAVSLGSGNQGSNRERDIRRAFIEGDLVTKGDLIEASLNELPEPETTGQTKFLTAEDVHDAVNAWVQCLGVEIRRTQIHAMRPKWASCSTKGTLTLSSDVLHLPADLVDYNYLPRASPSQNSQSWQGFPGYDGVLYIGLGGTGMALSEMGVGG